MMVSLGTAFQTIFHSQTAKKLLLASFFVQKGISLGLKLFKGFLPDAGGELRYVSGVLLYNKDQISCKMKL